jgi:hypothetical protein
MTLLISTANNAWDNMYFLRKTDVYDVKRYSVTVMNTWNPLHDNIACNNDVLTFIHKQNLFDFTIFEGFLNSFIFRLNVYFIFILQINKLNRQFLITSTFNVLRVKL